MVPELLAPIAIDSPSTYTKLVTTANQPATLYPAYTNPVSSQQWESFGPTTWTAAFLPSIFYQLNTRNAILCPTAAPSDANGSATDWLALARNWSSGLYLPDEGLTNTHDVGFLSWPQQFELILDRGNTTARNALLQMAGHLADRFSSVVGCTKSWDQGGVEDFEVVSFLPACPLIRIE